jgi:anti-sigma factor RsiW
MSTHITHEEMTELLLGNSKNAAHLHLHSCAECREEFARFQDSIQSFRVASHSWSENVAGQNADGMSAVVPSRGNTRWISGWALAAVAAALLIASLVAYRARNMQSPVTAAKVTTPAVSVETPNQNTQEQIAKDNEFLAQVDSEIAEGVPAPMQPLQITAASSSSSNNNTK